MNWSLGLRTVWGQEHPECLWEGEKDAKHFLQAFSSSLVWISIWMQKPRFLLASRQTPRPRRETLFEIMSFPW